MSDTPLTDKIEKDFQPTHADWVLHCRRLERELSEARPIVDQLMIIIEEQDANYLRMLSSLDEMDNELKYYKVRDSNGETILEYHRRELEEARSKVEEWQNMAGTIYRDLAEKIHSLCSVHEERLKGETE